VIRISGKDVIRIFGTRRAKPAKIGLQLEPQHGSCVVRVLFSGGDTTAVPERPSLPARLVIKTTDAQQSSNANSIQLTAAQADALRALPNDPSGVGFEPFEWVLATGR
jgi:hypothetical protein